MKSGLPNKSNRAEDQDGEIQILKDPEYDYESNLGRDRVTGIWEGQEAYPNNAVTLPLPTTPEEELEASIEALLRGVDACLADAAIEAIDASDPNNLVLMCEKRTALHRPHRRRRLTATKGRQCP